LKFDNNPLEDEKDLDHQEQLPILEYLLNKQFQDENLPPNPQILKRHVPVANFHIDLNLSSNLREIFEESPEIIEPSAAFERFVIENELPQSTNNILGELRYPFGRNFLYQLRKSPKNPIKALLPNEPHMKLSVTPSLCNFLIHPPKDSESRLTEFYRVRVLYNSTRNDKLRKKY